MQGRFEDLTDTRWEVIEPLLPKEPEQRGKGYPHAPWRQELIDTDHRVKVV